MMDDQLDLTFGTSDQLFDSGLDDWRLSRRKAVENLARAQGLPIGKIARIYFFNGPPCEGLLQLDEDEILFPDKRDAKLKLAIGRIRFTSSDIASCIAIED